MNGNILDTNVIIRLLNGDETVREGIYNLEDIFIPVIVFGELMFGAEKSQKKELNREKYSGFCSAYPILKVNQRTADEYGKIKCKLQKKGHIIPENDMWIGAIALSNDMTVITADNHFSYIENLKVINL